MKQKNNPVQQQPIEPVDNTDTDNNDCKLTSLDTTVFETAHNKMNLRYERLKQSVKANPDQENELKLVEQCLAEMNLAKTQHDKNLSEITKQDADIENIAKTYAQSVASLCVDLGDDGELSDLVLCSAKYQLNVLLCVKDACKQNELLQIIKELSLIVKDYYSLKTLLKVPDELTQNIIEKCNKDSEGQCREYLKEGIDCSILRKIIQNLLVFKDDVEKVLNCEILDELCKKVPNCQDEKAKLATVTLNKQNLNKILLCTKDGCSSLDVISDNNTLEDTIISTKASMDKLYQAIKALPNTAKQHFTKAKSHLEIFNKTIEIRDIAGAVLYYCRLKSSKISLCSDLSMENKITLASDLYILSEVFSAYGVCDALNNKIINSLWCTYRNQYIQALNNFYKKENEILIIKNNWILATIDFEDCVNNLDKKSLKIIEEEINKPDTEEPQAGDDIDTCDRSNTDSTPDTNQAEK